MTLSKNIFINPETDKIEVNTDIIVKPTTLVENDFIRVRTTGHDYAFVATVQNMTDDPLYIKFTGEAEWLSPCTLKNWFGLLADTEGYSVLEALVNGRYELVSEEDSE